MIYRIFVGFDTGGEPIYKWICDCGKCRTSTVPCIEVVEANIEEEARRKKGDAYAKGWRQSF